MKMYFDKDEMVNIREYHCPHSPKSKQQIADYLAKEVEEGRKDALIVLAYLPFTTSIEVSVNRNFVKLKPLSISVEVSEEFAEFLSNL